MPGWLKQLRLLSALRAPRRFRGRAFSSSPWALGKLPDESVVLGAVSYDPAISTIWEKMKAYLISAGCPFDFVLFTNYERQVAALMAGHVDIAWNGPVAHVLAQQQAGPQNLISLGMRDVDCDFVSVCVARKDASVSSVSELSGKVVATGAHDSPQAHLVPLYWLGELGVKPAEVKSFDLDLGKHGDTAIGEVKAMEALLEGQADAGLLSKMMWDRAVEGQLPSIDKAQLEKNLQVLPEAPPLFDHCQFDVLASTAAWKRESFVDAIFKMDIQNPEHQEVMRLEGIQQKWMPPRQEGYAVVSKALQAAQAKRHFSSSTGSRNSGSHIWQRSSLGHLPRSSHTWKGVRSFSSKPTVGVVGAGVAGLQAIRSLRAKGFDVKVFEQDARVGGVWRENYVNFGVQVPKQLYEFLDFPFNLPWGQYPTGPETQQYIEDYVDHFQLRDAIETGTQVESVSPKDSRWVCKTRPSDGGSKEETFDYCIIATGLYSKTKLFMPELPNQEKFQGKVLHSTNFQDVSLAEGKRVVVVGNGKSAVDCAVEASKAPGALLLWELVMGRTCREGSDTEWYMEVDGDGKEGNRANSLRKASPGGRDTEWWTEVDGYGKEGNRANSLRKSFAGRERYGAVDGGGRRWEGRKPWTEMGRKETVQIACGKLRREGAIRSGGPRWTKMGRKEAVQIVCGKLRREGAIRSGGRRWTEMGRKETVQIACGKLPREGAIRRGGRRWTEMGRKERHVYRTPFDCRRERYGGVDGGGRRWEGRKLCK
eukprot:s815_g21.t1